ncbi:MAG: hypothetical protein IT548_08640 [Alphaproteobacteria bacterium]|nr:hypothetical protein [Alphaproteobacteria bacterium]
MRLKLSALLLSTALATGLGATAAVVLLPAAPVALAQTAGEVDVDALLKLLPADAVGTYESKSYDAVSGVTTVRKLKIADKTAPDQNFVAVDEIGLRGLDLDAIAYVTDFSKYGATPDETLKQLFGDVTIKNGSVTESGKLVASLESLSFGGVQMKQMSASPPGYAGTPDDEAAGIKFAGALLDSIVSGPFEIVNFTVDEAGQKTSIGKITMGGYTRGQLGPSSLENMEASGAGITTKMASAENAGADITKIIPWMLKAEMPPVGPEPLLYLGGGSAKGIDYDIMGSKLTIAEYSLDAVNFYWLVPSSLKLAITDMVYTPKQGPDDMLTGGELGELGLSKLDLDFGLDWAFDGDAKTAQLKQLSINESQLFDSELKLDLNGIDLTQLVNEQTMQMAAMQVGITFGQLYLKNNGGFQKVLELTAREQQSTPDAIKQMLVQQLDAMNGGVPMPDGTVKPPTERVKGLIAALKAFVESPGTLTVKMEPASPVNAGVAMGGMMDPMGAADTLGLSAEATGQ